VTNTPAGTETLIGHLFDHPLPTGGWRRYALLFAEAVVAAVVAVLLPRVLGLDEPGLIALFLTSAGLSARMHGLLAENREAVWTSSTPTDANRRTTFAILTLFAGILTTFVVATLLLGPTQAAQEFAFALRAADVTNDTLLHDRFGSVGGVGGVLAHNLVVAVALFLLALVFRAYGALLALTWNAAVWGTVLTLLVERRAAQPHGAALPSALLAVVAVFPHLVIEGAADVVVALAGIFASKGLLSYELNDKRFARVLGAVLRLLFVAVIALGVAAIVETRLAPLVLGR
jgi:hypothetical protein